jgi:hypothetical protein
LLQIILRYVGYRLVAKHEFDLWFCRFADFSLVWCVAVMNVFAGREACCLAVSDPYKKKHSANLR